MGGSGTSFCSPSSTVAITSPVAAAGSRVLVCTLNSAEVSLAPMVTVCDSLSVSMIPDDSVTGTSRSESSEIARVTVNTRSSIPCSAVGCTASMDTAPEWTT